MASLGICIDNSECFARPLSWEGSGDAIDLGNNLTDVINLISPIGTSAFTYKDWHPRVSEILEEWQIVKREQLQQELHRLYAKKDS